MGSLGGERHGLEVSSLTHTFSASCRRQHQQTRAGSLVWHLHEVEPNPIRSESSLLPGKEALLGVSRADYDQMGEDRASPEKKDPCSQHLLSATWESQHLLPQDLGSGEGGC